MTGRLLPVLLGFLAAPVLAAETATRPADFDYTDAERRMDRLTVFPEVQGNVSLILSCFSQVQASGKMEQTACYIKDQYDRPYSDAVTKAAKKARMNPAIMGGKERAVFLQFRVEFIAEGEQRSIHFYLNPGYEENVKAYGYDHIAGQRAIGKKEAWMETCPKRAQYAVWVRAYLGEDGKTDNPTVVHADGIMPTAPCQDAIKQTILDSQYTPAYAGGEAVPSTYVEIFTN